MPRRARFLIREVEPKDLNELYRLAKHLNSVNFPHDRERLNQLLKVARKSFNGPLKTESDGQYLFVMAAPKTGRLAGTSMIFAQHGTPTAPHVFFDVLEDERYSTTLDRHFRHTSLRLGFSYDGPSEIGALVLDPKMRAMGLGKPLSFVRFLFMAMYRDRFRDEVIAELMPPLESDGRSRLWEHIGRKFTGLSYQEADKLSHVNKEFIISLFPMQMNATLLPEDVRNLIGQVGESTLGVRTMLESIGFKYAERIDPFDGGPHFHATTDDVSVVRHSLRGELTDTVVPEDVENTILNKRLPVIGYARALVAAGRPERPSRFRATAAVIRRNETEVHLSLATRQLLRVEPGDVVFTTPL